MSSAPSDNGGPYLLSIDMGTESARAGIFDTEGTPLAFAATTYELNHPKPGWAEQDPAEWWQCVVKSVKGAMEKAGVGADAIAGLSYDATTLTLVPLDQRGRQLRDAIMWMDVRASDQAERIARSDHEARQYNGGGEGPVSAEWFPSKALWLKENEPDVYNDAFMLVDCADWLTYQLTEKWTVNINTASARAYYNQESGGWPTGFYEEIGLGDIFDKLPDNVLKVGAHVGGLARSAAAELDLNPGTPVAQGLGDAWSAQLGMNVTKPGQMALITGSSHVLMGQSDSMTTGPGFFGAYPDAVLEGQYSVEGGQVSTGSVLKWFKDNFLSKMVADAEAEDKNPYDVMNEQVKDLPIGSDGLIVLDYWQGNRTPYTDPLARGMMWGFTLSHTPAHVYRAIQEGVCYGTAHILRKMGEAGIEIDSLVAAGGATNSELWTQMHADVTGLPVTLTTTPDAANLGACMLAAVGAELFDSIEEAGDAMVHKAETYEPNDEAHQEYQFFVDAYADTYPQMRELVHGVANRVSGRS
ncbi:MAG: FGGY-family carbohydrate kinase [Egibacteraceae bacterium]